MIRWMVEIAELRIKRTRIGSLGVAGTPGFVHVLLCIEAMSKQTLRSSISRAAHRIYGMVKLAPG